MTLSELARDLPLSLRPGDGRLPITGIACHSKQVRPGNLFVAIRDGVSYVPEALRQGASVIVAEEDFPSDGRAVTLLVEDAREALASLAHRFYRSPSEALRVIGITGTNGKTTVSYLVEACLKEAGSGVGLIGTIAHKIGERLIPAKNTTPGALELHSLFAEMVRGKLDYAVMEVSSHALDQKRVQGIPFRAAVFTNLGHDHLDYHKTESRYFEAKRRLFESLEKSATSIVNADSPYAGRIAKATRSRCLTYAIQEKADCTATSIEGTREGLHFKAVTPEGTVSIVSPLLGRYNVYNILAALGVGLSEGLSLSLLQSGIARVKGIPGRLERIEGGQPFQLFVDYAHTEEALRNVLQALRERTGRRLLLVFGCGGDRDALKRPRMAETAARMADEVIVTSDNPRSEDPQKILKEIAAGFPPSFPYVLEEDRERAIERALLSAREGDTVLIAGKGHEPTQIFRDRSVPFDDRKVCYELLSHSRYSQSHGRALSTGRG